MNRAILAALGTGLAVSGAAALDIAASGPASVQAASGDTIDVARAHQAARASQREAIHARYAAQRALCDGLGGFRRDQCLVRAHAFKGNALLHAAAPYDARLAMP